MDHTLTDVRRREWLAAVAAVLAAASVALLAYASHGSEGEAQARLQTAAELGFGHGVAIAALAPWSRRRLARLALLALLGGVLLFCGSLVLNVFAQVPTALAPVGGALLIGGWLLWAVDAVRR